MNKSEPPKHQCKKCKKVFINSNKLNRHKNKKFPCDINRNQCKYCKKIFYDNSTRTRHETLSCKKNVSKDIKILATF